MDFCLDKNITEIRTFNELLTYLFTKTHFEPEHLYFVVKEQNEGYLIQNPKDFESMQSICRQNEDYFPRFIVHNEGIRDFKILEQKGNEIGENLRQNSVFQRTWIVEMIGNCTIDGIIAGEDLGKFNIQQIEQNKYQIDYYIKITPGFREANFTARAFSNLTNSEFGPFLWVYFKLS